MGIVSADGWNALEAAHFIPCTEDNNKKKERVDRDLLYGSTVCHILKWSSLVRCGLYANILRRRRRRYTHERSLAEHTKRIVLPPFCRRCSTHSLARIAVDTLRSIVSTDRRRVGACGAELRNVASFHAVSPSRADGHRRACVVRAIVTG